MALVIEACKDFNSTFNKIPGVSPYIDNVLGTYLKAEKAMKIADQHAEKFENALNDIEREEQRQRESMNSKENYQNRYWYELTK